LLLKTRARIMGMVAQPIFSAMVFELEHGRVSEAPE